MLETLTDTFVAYHYVRSMPKPSFLGFALTGRVYVFGGFLSMSADKHDAGGMGTVEMRILVPGRCGRGVFVGDREFLFPPGTILKMLTVRKNTMFMERVHMLYTLSAVYGYGP